MREFINIIEQLNESTGLAGRKPGDVFRDQFGDELSFNEIRVLPEGGGKYSPEEMDNFLKWAGNIDWQNKRTAKSGAIALITLDPMEEGTPLGNDAITIGRFLDQAKPSLTDNYIPNTFNTGERVWKFGGKASASGEVTVSKTDSKLSPQDLLGDKIDLRVDDIMNQLAMSLGTDNPLYAVAHRIATGEPLPISFPVPEGYSFAAFRDYFCEILQPIALQKGQFSGNAMEAAEKFLGGSFENTLISFDESKTAGLSDSIMTTEDGREVKISTKGGKGATASVKNLSDAVAVLEQTKDGKKLLAKYKDLTDILKGIETSGQYNAPLYLAQQYEIITPDEVKKIQNLRNSQLTSLNNISALGLSKKLQNMAMNRGTNDPDNVNLFYHLTAAVAHKVAEYVNKNTGFSQGATTLLNNGALIQMYTKASEGEKSWKLGEFNTVYPGNSIKGVFLDAGKNYYSTSVKGNFTFKIDKGSGVPKDESEEVGATNVGRDKRSNSLAKASKDIVNPVNKPRETGTRTKRK